MTLCTIEAIEEGFTMAEKFLKWYKEGYWTPHDDVFDIGL
ncbi:hypothetical protein PPE_05285 [Paenibacillus polymyxa E681]|nr:hypothetical protein PPE_05285 [Paenibacillus polymyxa E681]